MKDSGVKFALYSFVAIDAYGCVTVFQVISTWFCQLSELFTEYLPIALYVDLAIMLALDLTDKYLLSTHT